MGTIDLRAYVLLDSLQAQDAAFLGTVDQGFLPLAGDASLSLEVSPGIEINRLTDIALKTTSVKPSMQIIERYQGLLEIHSRSQAEVRAAGAAILAEIGAAETTVLILDEGTSARPSADPDRGRGGHRLGDGRRAGPATDRGGECRQEGIRPEGAAPAPRRDAIRCRSFDADH